MLKLNRPAPAGDPGDLHACHLSGELPDQVEHEITFLGVTSCSSRNISDPTDFIRIIRKLQREVVVQDIVGRSRTVGLTDGSAGDEQQRDCSNQTMTTGSDRSHDDTIILDWKDVDFRLQW